MTRTTIDLNDELVARAMRRYNLRTKSEAVELALRMLAAEPLSVQEALQLEGSGWGADLGEIRSSRTGRCDW